MTATGQTGFSGSYDAGEVSFLLTPITPAAAQALYVAPDAKEGLIQRGTRHYSEMISPESAPATDYMAIFETALDRHGARMGREVAALARSISARVDGPITLASLVRAGVPLGVLLARGLRALGRDVAHFGISIIRDRGIDAAALDHIVERRPAAGLIFVDGWTGKGAIASELDRALAAWPGLAPRLAVLADPAGRAWCAAGHADWLIPSGILGSTVSGLISRSILNPAVVPPGGFHAAIHLTHLAPHDVSRRFARRIGSAMLDALTATGATVPAPPPGLRETAAAAIDAVAARYAIVNRNRIKPGIAEATRAVLRRAPERILVGPGCLGNGDGPGDRVPRDTAGEDLAGLRHLARQGGVAIETPDFDLFPYRAITIIADRA